MANDTITTVLELDLDPYRSALELLPKDAQKALKKLERTAIASSKETAKLQTQLSKATASKVSQHAKEQSRAAQKAARDTERAYNEQFTSIMGLSGAAFGGVAGDIEDLAISVSGVSGKMAALGVAIGALAIGPVIFGGLAAAAKSLADSGAEALEELREMGPAFEALVSAKAIANLDKYNSAMERLNLATMVAKVEIGGALAPALADLSDEVVRLTPALVKLVDKWVKLNDKIDTIRPTLRTIISISSLGAAPLAEWALGLNDSSEAAILFGNSLDTLTNKMGPWITLSEQALLDKENQAKADKAAAKAAATAKAKEAEYKKVILANAKAQGEEAVAIRKASEAMKTHGIVVRDGTINQDALAASNVLVSQSFVKVAKTAEEKAEDIAKAWDKIGIAAAYVQDVGGEAFAALQSFSDLASDAAAKEATANTARAKQRTAEIKQLRALQEDASGAELVQINKRIELRKDERETQREAAKEARKEARKAWKASKRAQVAAAVMNTAGAMVAAFAPPPAGYGPVAGAIAAPILGFGLAAQISTIRAQEPPAFHTGGVVAPPRQEVPALLEAGEGVVRREAMLQPGVGDTVRRLNEGSGTGGQRMAVYLNDRLVDVLVARAERTDAQSRRGLAMVGTRTMYDRRR